MGAIGWILAGVMLASGSAAHAIDYCALPKVFTSKSFPEISRNVEAQLPASCVKGPADSIHFMFWDCGDVDVALSRDEVKADVTLIVQSLITPPDFSACDNGKDYPATIIKKTYAFDGPSFSGVAAIVTEKLGGAWRAYYREEKYTGSSASWVEQSITGRSTNYRSSDIQIAGVKLVGSPFEQLKKALIFRGSTLLSSDESKEGTGIYTYSPFTGLGGVTKIEVQTVFSKIFYVKYIINNEQDYIVFINQLDSKYGNSNPYTTKNKCRERKWESGAAAAYGTYCSKGKKEIILYNSLVSDDLELILTYINDNHARNKQKRIDEDNF